MPAIVYPQGYYCYLLCDPRTGIGFYAGKGQKDRAWQHARVVAAGRSTGNACKDAKISEILMRGDEVEIQILGEYEDENDALEHEFEVVDSMPELTNIVAGGGGGPGGRRLTQDEIIERFYARMARIKARLAAKQEKKRRERESVAAAVLRNRYVSVARNDKQAKEIEVWLDSRGRLVKASRYNGHTPEMLRPKDALRMPSGRSNRNRRQEREAQLLREGKLIQITLPNGKIRLQRPR